MICFLRLEKIEFSGVRGQALSDLVARMFEEFTELMNTFQSQGNDPLDLSSEVCSEILVKDIYM